MKNLVPTLFPFIKLWDPADWNKPDDAPTKTSSPKST